MKKHYLEVANIIASDDYEQLSSIEIEKPAYFNWVSDVFEDIHLGVRPQNTALLWTDGEQTTSLSFQDLSNASNQLLNYLRKNGVEKEDVVLTQLGLQQINWTSMLAVIKGGLQLIPAATILGAHDLQYRFETLMPKVVIADLSNYEKIEEAERLIEKKVAIKILEGGKREGWVTWETIANESIFAAAAQTRSEDPLFLFFTSGTTGLPKVVIHTHFSYPVGHLTTSSWIGIKDTDIHFNISQPGWAKFSWSSFFGPWNMGACIFAFHNEGRFNAAQVLRLMEKHQISTFCAPPTALRLLIQEDLKAYQFNLRSCVAAGEPLNPEIIETWKNGTSLLIRDGFGQTESTCMIANLPDQKIKFGSMGKPLFLYNIVIADDDGNELPDNMEGSICVKTENDQANGIFKEYFKEPAKRKAVFKNNLYYTGDKAYRDEDGYIWFVGRDDDVIKSSDYRIGPFEIESVLIEHPAVLESAVVASPHELKGSIVKAFIILNNGYEANATLAANLFAFSKENLAPYKMPRLIEFVTELPKTISGKIRRVELRASEQMSKIGKEEKENEFKYSK